MVPGIGIRPDQADVDTDGNPTGQMRLIRAVLANAMNRKITEIEGKAVRVGLMAAHRCARSQHRVPVIADLIAAMLHPHEDDCEPAGVRVETMRQ